MENCFLSKLKLLNFRNFELFETEFESTKILITGKNGSGKTSILESISLLFPGKGLRGSKFSDIIKDDALSSHCLYDLDSYKGNYQLSVNLTKGNSKRVIKVNENNISPSELNELVMTFWLIPQQNILFNESQNIRRKFFDRLTFIFNENHATKIAKYEHYQRERFKIINEYNYDETWATIVEEKLAILAKEICDDRYIILNQINKRIQILETTFPKIECFLSSEIDHIYVNSENFIDDVKCKFREFRNEDVRSHKTNFGVLKTDFTAKSKQKDKDLSICSTGEQHAALISIKLAITENFMAQRNRKPLVLFDELFVHLDETNKEYLSNYLEKNEIQTFVTTTEKELCGSFSNNAQIISL